MNLEQLQNQLEKNNQWIQNGDLKLSIILTFIGILSGYIINVESITKFVFSKAYWISTLAAFFLFVMIICLIAGFFFSFKGLQANIKNIKKGLIFWGDIAEFKEWYYFKTAKLNQSHEELLDDYFKQVYITSKIATQKFKYVNLGILSLKFAVFFYILYLLLNFLNSI